ncbi:MAG: heparinase II/III family protein, partial [Oscillospiraceae bacterium]|nr:heparinase II/III family protein [Oscillospiraceae bacterium]
MAQYDGIQVVTDRTGWSSTDSMIFMNAKSAGSHSHRDALALLLHYDGRNLLTDTGMTSYDGSHLHFPFQRSTTRSHNTIEIDGLAQTLGAMVKDGANQGKIDIRGNSAVSTITSWSTANNPNLATLKVVGTNTTNAYHSTTFTHSRDVSFLKELGSILVVTDKIEPKDSVSHTYTQNWHCAPYSNAAIAKDAHLTGTTAYGTGPNLIIAQASTKGISASLQTGYDSSAPATPTSYLEYKQSAAGTVTYQTVLYPVAKGATATVAPEKITMSNTTDAQALAMEISISDSSKPELSKLIHYHSFEDSHVHRAFGNYSTDGATAMYALNKNGKLFFASLADGSTLTKDGKSVLVASAKLTDLSAVYEDGVLCLYSEDPKAQGCAYYVNPDGQKVEQVLLNGHPMNFTMGTDGIINTRPAYVLLDFTERSMAAQDAHWTGLRATAEVQTGKGILSGTVSGGDPNIRMTPEAEALGYTVTAGDIIELRMKTTITDGAGKGIQVFFQKPDGSYSEAYSCKNLSLDHASGRYTTIRLPFVASADYIGSVINHLRVDLLHVGSTETVTAEYEIDYIYLGPAEYAPSASVEPEKYLYFDFTNKPEDEERYAGQAYGGYPFDLECWGSNGSRNTVPVMNNAEGTMSTHILPEKNSAYIQTTDYSRSLTSEPLHYLPKADDRVQIRLRFEHCAPTLEVPKIMMYYIADNSKTVTNDRSSITLDPEKIRSGEDMILEFSAPKGFATAKCINALRFNIIEVTDDGSGESQIIFDYIYVGAENTLPMQDKLYFGFDNGQEAQERYSTNTYGGLNFDAGCWGVNLSRTNPPEIDEEAGTLSITFPKGSTGPYFQTTTGANNLTTMPLAYIPGEKDMVQLRVKFQNCAATTPYLCLYYIKDNSATVTSNNAKIAIDPALLNADTYTVLTFGVSGGFASAEVINSIRITATGITDDGSGKGKITFDYIYVGSEKDLPTPRHQLTFLNGDGSTLQTLTVHEGETAVYTGDLPTKASDANNHYSFAGWDQDLTNVTADLILTPKFTAQPHTFGYTETDGTTHTCSCKNCDYSEEALHSYENGVCICGQTEAKEPIEEAAWKLGHSLNLASDISVNYAITRSTLAGYDMDSVYVLTEIDTYKENGEIETREIKLRPVENGI